MKYRVYDCIEERFVDNIIIGQNGEFLEVRTSKDLGISLIAPVTYDTSILEIDRCTDIVDKKGDYIYERDLIQYENGDVYEVYYDENERQWLAKSQYDPIERCVEGETWEIVFNSRLKY